MYFIPRVFCVSPDDVDAEALQRWGHLISFFKEAPADTRLVPVIQPIGDIIAKSREQDYLVAQGNPTVLLLAALLFYSQHGHVNLLIPHDHKYEFVRATTKVHNVLQLTATNPHAQETLTQITGEQGPDTQ